MFAILAMPRLIKFQRFWAIALITAFAVLSGLPGWAQTAPASSPAASTPVPEASSEGLFFADVVVRGQPIFQIGGLTNLTAAERARIINRRIGSILAQSEIERSVRVRVNSTRSVATLQVNNRVLMTITQQDAQDFNLPVEILAQQWADELTEAFDQPPLAIDVGQRLYSTMRQFLRDAIDQLPALIGALLVIALTWAFAASMRRVVLAGAGRWEIDHNSKVLVSRLGYGAVWVLGTIVALGVLGLDFAALFGTLGLTSVAIGFSLRDVLSNYFSGIILLASRPFRLGDQIVIKEYEGTVTQIQLRATRIKTYDGRTVYIPNQEVFNASIVNNTMVKIRRSEITIGIDYEADIQTAQRIIEDVLRHTEGVEADPLPEVLVWELGANAVKLQVRIWVSSRRQLFLESTSRAAIAIKEALQAAGIPMLTEIYTIRLQDQPSDLLYRHLVDSKDSKPFAQSDATHSPNGISID